jgi:ribonucleotide monophosphatase NagD (HAD superfamily)
MTEEFCSGLFCSLYDEKSQKLKDLEQYGKPQERAYDLSSS